MKRLFFSYLLVMCLLCVQTAQCETDLQDLPITSIGDEAFLNTDLSGELKLPSGITSIGEKAFADNAGITSVNLPSSLNSIADNAFENCDTAHFFTNDASSYAYNWCVRNNFPVTLNLNTNIVEPSCIGCPLFYKGDPNLGGFYYWENGVLCYTTSPDVNTIQYCATSNNPPDGEPNWYPLTTYVHTDADCTHNGYDGIKCKVCDGWKNVIITPALGHDFVENWRVESTCASRGYIQYECSRHTVISGLWSNYVVGCTCGYQISLKMAHKWIKKDGKNVCAYCGATEIKINHLSQGDPRWKDEKLGNGKKTMSKEGCCLTALTMWYNYYQNTNYTPVTLQDGKLKPTGFAKDSSSLEWTNAGNILGFEQIPLRRSNDNSHELTQDEMREIYDIVHSGNPVILGLKNENDSTQQHYVLIKDYLGSTEQFEVGGFVVNDPGKTTITRLDTSIRNWHKPAVYTYLWKKGTNPNKHNEK